MNECGGESKGGREDGALSSQYQFFLRMPIELTKERYTYIHTYMGNFVIKLQAHKLEFEIRKLSWRGFGMNVYLVEEEEGKEKTG